MTEIKGGVLGSQERETQKQIIAQNLAKLSQLRKESLVESQDFPVEGLFYIDQKNRPLVRNDLGNRAIVISQEQLAEIGFISFISSSGEVIDVFADDTGYEPEDLLVIFPDELGEASEQTLQVLEFASKIIKGEYGASFPDEDSLSPQETFSGPVLDLNDEILSLVDQKLLLVWIEEHLGAKLEEALVKSRLVSAYGTTTVTIFETVLGQENDPWYLSQWQNTGEKPSFIFWPEEMYEVLELDGYETLSLE